MINKIINKKLTVDNVLFCDSKKMGDLLQFLNQFTENRHLITKIKRKKLIKNPLNTAVIYRQYHLDSANYQAELTKIYHDSIRNQLVLINATKYHLANRLFRCGIHCSDKKSITDQRKFRQLAIRYQNTKRIVSFSCHSLASLIKASKNLFIDIIFISPVFATTSHNHEKTIPLLQLRKFMIKNRQMQIINNNIFALGGIDFRNIKSISKSGFVGFGGIDIFIKSLQKLQ